MESNNSNPLQQVDAIQQQASPQHEAKDARKSIAKQWCSIVFLDPTSFKQHGANLGMLTVQNIILLVFRLAMVAVHVPFLTQGIQLYWRNGKFFLFLSNWTFIASLSYFALTFAVQSICMIAHSVAVLVHGFAPPCLVHCSTACSVILQILFNALCINIPIVSIVFWAFLYKDNGKYNSGFNYVEHAITAAMMIVDLILDKMRLQVVLIAVDALVVTTYMIFILVYSYTSGFFAYSFLAVPWLCVLVFALFAFMAVIVFGVGKLIEVLRDSIFAWPRLQFLCKPWVQ